MNNEDDEDDDDHASLGFVDTLCCGLGGMVFIFLIFATLPQLGVDEQTDNSIESLMVRHRKSATPSEKPSSDSPALFQVRVSGEGFAGFDYSPASGEDDVWQISEQPATGGFSRQYLFFSAAPHAFSIDLEQTPFISVEVKALHSPYPYEELRKDGILTGLVYNPGSGLSLKIN